MRERSEGFRNQRHRSLDVVRKRRCGIVIMLRVGHLTDCNQCEDHKRILYWQHRALRFYRGVVVKLCETMPRDIQYAVRQIAECAGIRDRRHLTLALAIGANTAIFSVVRDVLLQPLPYHDPARLLCI
jgi:hypothetical protein